MANVFAVKSGNWSDPTVWNNGILPTSVDDVYSNTFTVTVDGTFTVLSLRNTASTIVNAIPTMTSNLVPSGIASSSNAGSNSYLLYDKVTSSPSYLVGFPNYWFAYEFPTAKVIKRYAITHYYYASAWRFEGWDGSNWITLDTQTGFVGANGSAVTFTSGILSNTTAYIKYRVYVTALGTWTDFSFFEILYYELGYEYVGTAGGTFTLANGSDLTATASTSLIPGGLIFTPVITFSLTSGNTATFRGGVEIFNGTPNFACILMSGLGTFNIIGNFTVTQSSAGTNYIINVNGNGVINLIGNLQNSGNGQGAISTVMYVTTSPTLNITGNLIGGSNAIAPSIYITGAPIINITGNITAGTGAAIYATTTCTINNTGNINANTVAGILATANGFTLTSVGTTTASSTAAGVSNPFTAGVVKHSGNVVNNLTYVGIYCPRVTFENTNSSWKFNSFSGSDRTIYAAGVSLGNPAISNVRSGITYGPSSELTGTLAVPPVGSVLLGVPTDNTVGTYTLTALDVANSVWNLQTSGLTASGSIGERLKNVSTIETTGAQIAAFK